MITLSPAERRQLNTVPYAANEVGWHEACDLERGHEGPHHALAQQSRDNDPEYWVRFSDDNLDQVEIVALDGCPARDGDELCTLFAEHPGAHNSDTRWESRERDNPPPAPGHNHANYLAHRRAATETVAGSADPAQVHASLAIAAALNRVADLLES